MLLDSWVSLRCAVAGVSCAAGVALLAITVLLRLANSWVKVGDGDEENKVLMYVP